MIYVGIDDTDLPDTLGTNHLARHVVERLAGRWRGRLVTRHQLLDDPRVPCTRKNGCVAIVFDTPDRAPGTGGLGESLADDIAAVMRPWCPAGSDPGLCVTTGGVPASLVEFGRRCQRELVRQEDARKLANEHGVVLRGLGGTEDGVIGALAAVGLASTRDDGRVTFIADAKIDHAGASGVLPVGELGVYGIDEVRRLDDRRPVGGGAVDVGKRLRPCYRSGKVVLFVSPFERAGADWLAERVL